MNRRNARVKVWCLTAWRHPNAGAPSGGHTRYYSMDVPVLQSFFSVFPGIFWTEIPAFITACHCEPVRRLVCNDTGSREISTDYGSSRTVSDYGSFRGAAHAGVGIPRLNGSLFYIRKSTSFSAGAYCVGITYLPGKLPCKYCRRG